MVATGLANHRALDRDDDRCQLLKRQLDSMALAAGLQTRTTADADNWQVVNRLAIEELEAWYFGNWPAVRSAYPRVARTIPAQARSGPGVALVTRRSKTGVPSSVI